jgi:ABC-type sugar transport system substrate-binding protein
VGEASDRLCAGGLAERSISRRALIGGMAFGGAAVGLGMAGRAGAAATAPFQLTAAAQSKKIAFSQPDTSASIWQPLMAGARDAAAKRGYELLVSHSNSQLDAQLAEIETWIAEGIAGIIVLPLDNNSLGPLIAKAHRAGIRFLDYSDNALPNVDGWVIFDNLQGARIVGTYAGQWANDTLGGKAEVALLTHQIQLTGRQRIEGAVEALQKVAPGAKVVAQHEGVLSPQTLPAAQAMLEAHPNINMFICIADEGCDGCLHAFLQTHPSEQRTKEMFICGFDGSAPVIQSILNGSPIRATGALDAVAIGAASVNATINAVQGTEPTQINFPYVLVDYQSQELGKKLLKELG